MDETDLFDNTAAASRTLKTLKMCVYVQALLPIHCCAMQGQVEVMQLFQKHGLMDSIVTMLNNESGRSPPSLLHLAIANGFVECAEWLVNFISFSC